MFSHASLPQTHLSPAYRRAQRELTRWLEASPHHARRAAFVARGSLGALDPVEYDRLARWLAWTCAALRSQGSQDPAARLERLDTTLGAATRAQLQRLPGAAQRDAARRLRHSA